MRLRSLLVALLVLGAGCSGFGGEGPRPGDARLAAPQGAAPTATDSSPPGLDGGVADAARLVAAHEQSLRGVSVALVTTRSVRSTVAGETNRSRRTRVRTDGNGTRFVRTVVDAPSETRAVELWQDGEAGLRHVAETGETTAVAGVDDPGERYRTGRLASWLAAGTYEVRRTESSYVLVATGYAHPDGGRSEADTARYEARAIVTPAGRVTAMTATLVTVERNKWGRQTVVRSYSYRVARTGGVTVPRPAWVADGRSLEGAVDG
ncbi:hypothetical protein [Haloarcula litorea]|uniref:hypothetical protein n=1 Tax=Haloarcula litorea TaxID=3032579 RepID=UPI0023E8D6A3|nr:hypothetical protein [Halomicroarcula sp. GDY20]